MWSTGSSQARLSGLFSFSRAGSMNWRISKWKEQPIADRWIWSGGEGSLFLQCYLFSTGRAETECERTRARRERERERERDEAGLCCRYTGPPLSLCPFSSTNPSTNPLQAGEGHKKPEMGPSWEMSARIAGGSARFTCANVSVQPMTKRGSNLKRYWFLTAVGSLTMLMFMLWKKKLQFFCEKKKRPDWGTVVPPPAPQESGQLQSPHWQNTHMGVKYSNIPRTCLGELPLASAEWTFLASFHKHTRWYWFSLCTTLTVFSFCLKYCYNAVKSLRTAASLRRGQTCSSIAVFNFRSWFCINCCGWKCLMLKLSCRKKRK